MNHSASPNLILTTPDLDDGCESDDPELALRLQEEMQERANDSFRINAFNVVMDCLLSQIETRFESSKSIAKLFSFLWDFNLDSETAEKAARALVQFYTQDLTENFESQFKLLRRSRSILLQPERTKIKPLDLLNAIYHLELHSIMPEICIALRIFLCFSVSVAEGERSFNSLGSIKSRFRTTMLQHRLNSLAIISIESELAASINFDQIIDDFAAKAARRVKLVK